MKIKYVYIQNFRKLKSARIEFSDETTLFVGANNSGKTSAMDALICFLKRNKKNEITLKTIDFTMLNWVEINKIGDDWEQNEFNDEMLSIQKWEKLLPTLDLWLNVSLEEIHYVIHLLPTLSWNGGQLGIRLRFEPKNIKDLYDSYVSEIKNKKDICGQCDDSTPINLWPNTLKTFLDRKLGAFFTINTYLLDPENNNAGEALPIDSMPLGEEPLAELIRVDIINAQRGFADDSNDEQHSKRKLSDQLRTYYNKHLNPADYPSSHDLKALKSIEDAESDFNNTLEYGFKKPLNELKNLGYPGNINNANFSLMTQLRPIDGLTHASAIQFNIIGIELEGLTLPENYNGVGYQNLISMSFSLMSFRDAWLQVGKLGMKSTDKQIPPLHLVLIEEPEAHLHVQVQQVFIREAYRILKNGLEKPEYNHLNTQLILSTHSSHVAHECSFKDLRYFKRTSCDTHQIPISTVVNLANVFDKELDDGETERFVTRYLKVMHCDLFFADAIILIEGSAERILIPHFIDQHRSKFEKIAQSYITILEVGGSHAHRLKPLIEHLDLTTLIITDLDSVSQEGRHPPVKPEKGQGLITGNSTLTSWIPKEKLLDNLLSLNGNQKHISIAGGRSFIRVAYQIPISVDFNKLSGKVLANTLEDATIYTNISIISESDHNCNGLLGKAKKIICNDATNTDELSNKIYDCIRAAKSGEKAEFALDLLALENHLVIPNYINDGLMWLQDQLLLLEKRDSNFQIGANDE